MKKEQKINKLTTCINEQKNKSTDRYMNKQKPADGQGLRQGSERSELKGVWGRWSPVGQFREVSPDPGGGERKKRGWHLVVKKEWF